MSNFLAEIYQHKLAEIALRKKQISSTELKLRAEEFQKKFPAQISRNFFEKLRAKSDAKETAIICEIKRGSPSAGMIREGFDITEIAKIYEQAGAACLSVLTEERYFLGSDDFLRQARAASTLPILRKDFMIDPYQIYEAKLMGADCILLIVALLDDGKLIELEQVAFECGLSVLIEIHDEEELKRALKLKSKLLGVNNRNLKSLKTDLTNSLNLAPMIPPEYVLVSESGIKTPQDIKILKRAGFNCFLIGEHFMRQAELGAAVRELIC